MNNSILIENTAVILAQLKKHTNEYLSLLSKDERSLFVKKWGDLSDQADEVSLSELVVRLNEILYDFEVLRSEFLPDANIDEIKHLRFNPNNINTKPKDWNVPIVIPNEVITVGKKIAQVASQISQ